MALDKNQILSFVLFLFDSLSSITRPLWYSITDLHELYALEALNMPVVFPFYCHFMIIIFRCFVLFFSLSRFPQFVVFLAFLWLIRLFRCSRQFGSFAIRVVQTMDTISAFSCFDPNVAQWTFYVWTKRVHCLFAWQNNEVVTYKIHCYDMPTWKCMRYEYDTPLSGIDGAFF